MKADTNKSLSQNVRPDSNGLFWFTDDDTIEVTVSDKRIMTMIRKLQKAGVDVTIDQEPCKDNGGFMIALIPRKCLKFGKVKPAPVKGFKKQNN